MAKNNVLIKFRNVWNTLGSNQGMHLTHNCVQTSCDILPIKAEAVVVKIYKYFYKDSN